MATLGVIAQAPHGERLGPHAFHSHIDNLAKIVILVATLLFYAVFLNICYLNNHF